MDKTGKIIIFIIAIVIILIGAFLIKDSDEEQQINTVENEIELRVERDENIDTTNIMNNFMNKLKE